MLFTLKILRWILGLFIRIITFPFRLARRLLSSNARSRAAGASSGFGGGSVASTITDQLSNNPNVVARGSNALLTVAAFHALVAVTGALSLETFFFLRDLLPTTPLVFVVESAQRGLLYQDALASLQGGVPPELVGYAAYFGAFFYGVTGYGLRRGNWYAGVAGTAVAFVGTLTPFLTTGASLVSGVLGLIAFVSAARATYAVRALDAGTLALSSPAAWSPTRRFTAVFAAFTAGVAAEPFFIAFTVNVPADLWFVPATPIPWVLVDLLGVQLSNILAIYLELSVFAAVTYGLARRSQGAWVAAVGLGVFGVLRPLLDLGFAATSWVAILASLLALGLAYQAGPFNGRDRGAPDSAPAQTAERASEGVDENTGPDSADRSVSGSSDPDVSAASTTAEAATSDAPTTADSTESAQAEPAVSESVSADAATAETDAADPTNGGTDDADVRDDDDEPAPTVAADAVGPAASAVAAANDRVVCLTDDAAVAVDDDGEQWRTPGSYVGVACRGDRTYLASADGEVTALDADGGDAWVFPHQFSKPTAAGPVVADGAVVAASEDGRVAALAPDRGDVAWNAYLDAAPSALAPTGRGVYAARTDDITAVDADGVTSVGPVENAIGLASVGDTVVAATTDRVTGVRDGAEAWTTDVSDPVAVETTGDAAVVATADGDVTAFAPDGTTAWSSSVDATVRDLAADEGRVLVATDSGVHPLER
ncbi:PQQ-binding-like beta-propeller repeat protein [Salarchaeum sp. III]|uniref:outer membrane protein assembly factor BamB family protein n=1 Tax=Salarchaeum sp. III TaxID=3107927 RepID=UPI002ED9430D